MESVTLWHPDNPRTKKTAQSQVDRFLALGWLILGDSRPADEGTAEPDPPPTDEVELYDDDESAEEV